MLTGTQLLWYGRAQTYDALNLLMEKAQQMCTDTELCSSIRRAGHGSFWYVQIWPWKLQLRTTCCMHKGRPVSWLTAGGTACHTNNVHLPS